MKSLRMSVRRLLILIAAVAVLLTVVRFATPRLLGCRQGGYTGLYWYFDENWTYHEVRGAVIYDSGMAIFVG
jgi:hypothetical protein